MKEFFQDTYYINEKFPENAAVDNDGDKSRHNLLLHKKYIVRSLAPLDLAMRNEHMNTQPGNGILTNGKYYSEDEDFYSRQLFRISIGAARDIVFDIGCISTADTLRIGFVYITEAGITLPSKIALSVSDNGREWHTVFTDNPKHNGEAAKQIYEKSFTPFTARYVKLTLHVFSFIAMDEVELYGIKGVSKRHKRKPLPDITPSFPDRFPPPDTLDGCRNILLIINYLPDTGESRRWKKEYFFPLVAYCGKNGAIKDTMFDTFLFLPKDSKCDNGAYVSMNPYALATSGDRLKYKDWLFDKNDNLHALNDAVLEYRRYTGDNNFRVNVILPVLTSVPRGVNFGDIDGDSRAEDYYTAEGRTKILLWWTKLLTDTYTACNFKGLKLAGFYWYDESIPYDDDIYLDCLKDFADFIHRQGYKLVWGPWYQAPGIGCFGDYGIDYASMKPNYTWNDEFTVERLKSSIAVSKFIGAGVQLEIHPSAVEEEKQLRKYRQHLKFCFMAGCHKSISTFYQGISPGEFYKSYIASSPLYRCIYDDTYKYIKGKLKEHDFELKQKVFTTKMNKTLRLKLSLGRGRADAIFAISGSAMHGSVKMSCDGRMTYYPDRGFTGIDSFIVNISDTMNSRDEKILINVRA